jgi:acyl-CoA thioesterase-1
MTTAKLFALESLVIVLVAVTAGFIYHANRPHPKVTKTSNAISYLPLGDSYTIGESVQDSERWPNQLVNKVSVAGKQLKIVDNPSVTGYTTQNLIDRELPLVPKLKPDFVTIQIGVNDYVQHVDAAVFAKNLNYIITTVQAQLPNPANLVLVTIPDYGKTPTGAQYGSPASTEIGIKAFNDIIVKAGAQYRVPVADIFAVSQQVAADPSLIAADGLHPSAKEYTAWTDIIYATVQTNHLPL